MNDSCASHYPLHADNEPILGSFSWQRVRMRLLHHSLNISRPRISLVSATTPCFSIFDALQWSENQTHDSLLYRYCQSIGESSMPRPISLSPDLLRTFITLARCEGDAS